MIPDGGGGTHLPNTPALSFFSDCSCTQFELKLQCSLNFIWGLWAELFNGKSCTTLPPSPYPSPFPMLYSAYVTCHINTNCVDAAVVWFGLNGFTYAWLVLRTRRRTKRLSTIFVHSYKEPEVVVKCLYIIKYHIGYVKVWNGAGIEA